MDNNELSRARLISQFNTLSQDYERRFFTSLTIGSATGFAALLSFSQTYKQSPELFLKSVLPSLWAFFIALIFSGTLPFITSQMYKYERDYLGRSENSRILIERGDSQNAEVFKRDGLRARLYSRILRWVKRLFILISGLGIVLGVFWPLYLITCTGKLF